MAKDRSRSSDNDAYRNCPIAGSDDGSRYVGERYRAKLSNQIRYFPANHDGGLMSALFVTVCSLTKATGGTTAYNQNKSITTMATKDAERLATRRDEVRELVKSDEAVDWQGVQLKDLDYNLRLVKGHEFGGRRDAAYMPALDRYQGRFFQALGDAEKARCRSNDNTLILSGLYGLLRPSEPMQLYSCPLKAEVARIWQRDELLTDILRAYARHNDILRVFDLTAMEAYRRLIDWNRVAADGIEVLHCFDSMAAGASALTSFGRLFRHLLSLGDDELIDLDPLHPPTEFGTCCLHRSTEPPAGYPNETWESGLAPEVLGGGYPDAGPWRFTMSSRFPRDARGAFPEVLRAVVEICSAPMSPRGDMVKRLSGHDGRLWRYRLADHRLVYEPDSTRRVVRLLRYGPRGGVYSGL